jgi:hypothetical protein
LGSGSADANNREEGVGLRTVILVRAAGSFTGELLESVEAPTVPE